MKHGLTFSFLSRCMGMPIVNLDQISQSILPLEDCRLQIGDSVEEGQLLCPEHGDYLYHAPFGGTVDNIILHRGIKYYYFKKDPILSRKNYLPQEPLKRPPMELIEVLRRCGVEDSGRPLWKSVKNAYRKIDAVVVNGIESEPFLCADSRILYENTKEVLLGAEYLRHICGAKDIVIVLPKGSDLKERAAKVIGGIRRFRIYELDHVYPQAYEKFILAELFGKELPRGADNTLLRAEIFSPSALLAAEEALLFHKPHTECALTIDGAFCESYGVFRAPIGTPVHHFLRPYSAVDSYIIINGGPISGTPADPKKGIDRGTKALLVFIPTQLRPEKECTSCGLCVEVCPIGLAPPRLYDMICAGEFERAERFGMKECIACNACSYVCPSYIPLGRVISEKGGTDE